MTELSEVTQLSSPRGVCPSILPGVGGGLENHKPPSTQTSKTQITGNVCTVCSLPKDFLKNIREQGSGLKCRQTQTGVG